MTPRAAARADLIGDTAIAVLAAEGARGLTHRAVDRAAGLPPGSTSNHARTRAALLTCALKRIAQLDAAEAASAQAGSPAAPPEATPVDLLAAPIATMLHRGLTRGRTRLLARYELALEATRRPDLRAVYDEVSRPLRDPAVAMLASAGSRAPERHARVLIAWCDGVQFDSLAGAGAGDPPSLAELRTDLAGLIRGMLEG